MKFLSVGSDAKHVEDFNHFVKKGDCVCFVIFHSPDCHFCVTTLPEWKEISSELGDRFKHMDNVMVADIDVAALGKTAFNNSVKGLPTMLCITENGKKVEQIEEARLKNDSRKVDGFVEWIELKTPSVYYSNEKLNKKMVEGRKRSISRTKNRGRSRSKTRHRAYRGGKKSRKRAARK
jgi:hypothetical protein